MSRREVPQPHPSRMVPFAGHPLVVGMTPGQPDLVLLTAAEWSSALGGVTLHLAWACPGLQVVEEFPDGSVRTTPADPDSIDDSWRDDADAIRRRAEAILGPRGAPYRFDLLGGRADRALTHLARAVGASAFVVGARRHRRRGLRAFVDESVAAHLAHHQHRPVLIVPVEVVGWKDASPWE